MDKKRLTAVKTSLDYIGKGKFCSQEGFNPSYVLSPTGQRLSRVRILATVVDKFMAESGKFASLTLDDGKDTIRLKVFNAVSMFENIEKGKIIDVISRVKEYQNEIYLVPEVIKEIEDPNMELLRLLELRKQEKESQSKKRLVLENKKQVADQDELKKLMSERFGIEPEETEAFLENEQEPHSNSKTDVIKLIESLDSGEGCDYQELIQASGLPEDQIDTIVNELLEEGTCFEPRPGKIKKL